MAGVSGVDSGHDRSGDPRSTPETPPERWTGLCAATKSRSRSLRFGRSVSPFSFNKNTLTLVISGGSSHPAARPVVRLSRADIHATPRRRPNAVRENPAVQPSAIADGLRQDDAPGAGRIRHELDGIFRSS